VPVLNPAFALSSPVAIELFLVPLALAIAWLEFARFRAMQEDVLINQEDESAARKQLQPEVGS
jgi:hypothetical protein